ncbi:MAG TPA: hypothetical protein VHP12_03695 [Chitinophagaceae bacterium]|nr:hypothetical protein [Chitinophagaceae bacterium]
MKPITYLLVGTIALFSCTTPRYIYAPSAPNINYFKQKGDNKVTADFSYGNKNGLGSYNRGIDIQTGYAISDHFAVAASYNYGTDRDIYYGNNYSTYRSNQDTNTVTYKRHFFEISAGYFLPLNKKKTVTYNLYAGVGLGVFAINETDLYNNINSLYTYKSNTTKIFVQSGFNFMISPYVNFSFTDRLMSVYYNHAVSSYADSVYPGYDINRLNGNTLSVLEHSFNFQFGIPPIKWMKINAGITTCIPFDRTNMPGNLLARSFSGNVGLAFNLFESKRSKK